MDEEIAVEIRGAPWKLLNQTLTYDGKERIREVLIDGPRGTGKTLGVGWIVRALWDRYPGCRGLFVRRTRKSITQSFCPDFEQIVCRDIPSILSGGRPGKKVSSATRQEYVHPNGSMLALAGMDDRGKVYSTNWDFVICEEARQFTKDDIVDFYGVLRQWTPGMKEQLLIELTNPDGPSHHLLRRVREGESERMQSYHKDNPKWWDRINGVWYPKGQAFIEGLQKLPGVLYDRNYLGLWKAAEGAVWANWDENKHVVNNRPDPRTVWRAAAMDWGYTDACVLLVGEKDENGKITICREIYRHKMGVDWWAHEVLAARRDLDLKALVVDPSRPEVIDYFNKKVATEFGDMDAVFARGADNRRATSSNGDLAGLDLVRHYIDTDRLVAWSGRMRHYPDPELDAANLACSLTDEIPMYVYWRPRGSEEDENAGRDRTDPNCDDHACDALRYLVTFMHNFDFGPSKPKPIWNLEPEHMAILKAMGQWPPKENPN